VKSFNVHNSLLDKLLFCWHYELYRILYAQRIIYSQLVLQSHAGEISLLPALPPGWDTGSVSGLRARGGFEVGMQWKNGHLQSAAIKNSVLTTFKVCYGDKITEISMKASQTLRLNTDLKVME
jgi:alpha-L-fucosidase 2